MSNKSVINGPAGGASTVSNGGNATLPSGATVTYTATTTSSDGSIESTGGYRSDDTTDSYGANFWVTEQDGVNEIYTTTLTAVDSSGNPKDIAATQATVEFSDVNTDSASRYDVVYLYIDGQRVNLNTDTRVTFVNNSNSDYYITADGGVRTIQGRSTASVSGSTVRPGEIGKLIINDADGFKSIGLGGAANADTANGYLYNLLVDDASFICFSAGTLIETDRGAVAIETLRQGDLVMTRDNGLQPIRWIGSQKLDAERLEASERLRPIRIRRHALGTNIPSADLVVSPQHRVLVRSKIAQKMFGCDEVLVAAKQLCQIDGIDIAHDLEEVEYFHFLFDQHEVVVSNGAETESLFTGPEALKSVGPAAAEEIFAIFPELAERDYAPVAARKLATGRMGRKLAIRHKQNAKALVS